MHKSINIQNFAYSIKQFVQNRFSGKPKNFAILAHARSGSTTLTNLLMLHESIDIIREPFNKTRASWGYQYLDDVKDKSTFNKVIKKIYAEHTGFKHLLTQLPKEYNLELLYRVPKTIFLRRKNLLKSAVSACIAEQTKTWQSDQEAKQLIRSSQFTELSLERLEAKLAKIHAELKFYEDYIQEHRVDVYNVYYESFFDPHATESERFRKLQDICDYLGVSNSSGAFTGQVDALLSPDITKLNGSDTYKKIPNIDVIEQTFGSRYGYLFE